MTIKKIAEIVGVSRGTVDRVIHKRGGVKPEIEKKILLTIKQFNYTPSIVGRQLALKKKENNIGFIILKGATPNPFYDDVICGVKEKSKELKQYGINVSLHYSPFGDYKKQASLIDKLVLQGINGIAITPINHPLVAKKLNNAIKNNIAVVTVNTDITGVNKLAYVGSDFYKCGVVAGNLMGLLTKSVANVGVVIGSYDILCHSERLRGFQEEISKNYPNININTVVQNFDDDTNSYDVTKKMLEDFPSIDAVFLASAGIYGASNAILEHKQKKLIVICYDTIPITKKMIEEDVISATIGQQPFLQGSKPLALLAEYFLNKLPYETVNFYTEAEIKIKSNL